MSALRAIVLVFHNLIRPKGDRITTHDGFKIIKQKKANMTTFYNGGRTKNRITRSGHEKKYHELCATV